MTAVKVFCLLTLVTAHCCNHKIDTYDRGHTLLSPLLPIIKLQLHNAIYRLRFHSNPYIHILSFSNSHNNIASIKKNRGDKSFRVIVALSCDFNTEDIFCNSVSFVHLKLQLHDAIYRLRFYSNSLSHILSLSNLHNNVASIQKNRGDKSHCVIVA